mgnify:CR=1 FL=1|jgi:NADH-quinone oxidoreductase subunit A
MNYIFILLFFLVGLLLVGSGLLVSRLMAPQNPSETKASPYECGEDTIGETWIRFGANYYIFALLFLLFSVEAAFLLPWAYVFKQVGVVALIEGGIFIFILFLGLVYAWKKGVLEWK